MCGRDVKLNLSVILVVHFIVQIQRSSSVGVGGEVGAAFVLTVVVLLVVAVGIVISVLVVLVAVLVYHEVLNV